MKPSSSVASLFSALLAWVLLLGFAAEQVHGQNLQRLSAMIAKKDLAGIRAAVEQDATLLNQKDSRNQRTPLHQAIQSGHANVVELLLELGAPTDAVDRRKQTPLHFALSKRQHEIIKLVLAKTEDVNQRDGHRKATSLMYAIMYRNSQPGLIEALIEKGADVNLKNSIEQTALHLACYNDNLAAAKAMIAAGAELDPLDNNSNTPFLAACMVSPQLTSEMFSSGADPLVKNRQGQTALHLVCRSGSSNSPWNSDLGVKVFGQLLSKFDEVDLKDKQQMTPLVQAVYSQSSKFLKPLIERGADPNIEVDGSRFGIEDGALISVAVSRGDADTVKALLQAGANVNQVNAMGQTPLHSIAAIGADPVRRRNRRSSKGFTQTVEVLLAAKADPNAKNKEGRTPLAIAASRNFFTAVALLVERTDELDFDLPGGSFLHWAASNEQVETCKHLLQAASVDVNALNSNGRSPLQLASENGNAELVKILIDKSADLNLVDGDGSTALLIAAAASNADVVVTLLDAGADTSAVDSSGHSALHLAAWAGDSKTIKHLLGKIKVAQAKTSSGYTPLHAAAWNGHDLALGALLAGGADPNVADSDGWTPLHKAAYRGHAKAVKTLIENGADKSIANGVEMTALQLAQSNGKSKQIEPLLK